MQLKYQDYKLASMLVVQLLREIYLGLQVELPFLSICITS